MECLGAELKSRGIAFDHMQQRIRYTILFVGDVALRLSQVLSAHRKSCLPGGHQGNDKY